MNLTLEQFLDLYNDEQSSTYVFILINDGLGMLDFKLEDFWHINFKENIRYINNKDRIVKSFLISSVYKYPVMYINLE